MARKLKLTLVALVAMTSCAVAAQGANGHTFTGGSEPTYLTAIGSNHTFSIGGASVTCETATFSGQMWSTSETVTLIPTYGGVCKLGEILATFTNLACRYDVGGWTSELHAPVSLFCFTRTAGMEISAAGCRIYIGDSHGENTPVNQGLGGVRFTKGTSGGINDLTMTFTMSNLAYETNGAFACVLIGLPSTGTNGTYAGSATLLGYTNGTHTTQTSVTFDWPGES